MADFGLKQCPFCGEYGHFSSKLVENAIEKIKAEGYAVQKWIPCSERLPERTGYYLVWLDSEIIDIAEFYTYADFVPKEIENNYWNKASKVLYWMPLPPAPESEVQDDADNT